MADRGVTKTTIELPTALLNRVKIRAVDEGLDLRTLVILSLEMRLKKAAKARAR